MRVILAGGGTAGHINPAISIADTIKKHEPKSEFLFVGTKSGMESRLVPDAGYKIEFVEVRGFCRKITPSNIKSVFMAMGAVAKCRNIIKRFCPDVVVGTGGYVSGPLLFAASLMGIPTLIHEQNVFAGMTSKMLSGRVDTVCISFGESKKYFSNAKNVVLTGNPVREKLFDISYNEARARLGVGKRPLIVAFGGSLGAKRLNECMTELIRIIPEGEYSVIFATGDREYESVSKSIGSIKKDGVEVLRYIYNMDEVMSAADLLVCRAGAITVSELSALGKPSVLIPSPNVTDNHQYYNAKALSDCGAAVLIEEKDLTSDLFVRTVTSLASDTEHLIKMGRNSAKIGIKNATEIIYEEIKKLI